MKLALSIAAAAFAALVSAPAHASVLDTVKQRGTLNCGTDNTAPGFGYLNTKTGKMEGFDVDSCRAVAAAVLGDASKVNFVTVTDKSRFSALQTGQVDVVFAHTTVKPSRESAITIDFLPITFWDGTGVMVKTASKVTKLDGLEGANLCTTQGSGTEPQIATMLKKKGWTNKVLTYENLEKLFGALGSGRCDAMITDKSALAAWRGNSTKPADFFILPEILDKSPFAGFVVSNDSRWRNALRWIIFAQIQAEESGITSATVESLKTSDDPSMKKFVGVEGTYGKDFGLPADFVLQIVKQVGNFGEMYDRNLGPKTPYFIDRKGTANALSTDGGAMISPLWD
ncbi:transporter substrate-binding domain-containing protein [Rhizobium rhizogenes]|uniref:transporter substrate-binding domain-containing protein n=1 Tax=Rhizobium rhizogenes TaxID=359 RepID=UPI001573236D|nr:transporter substrate-binding domain-containing protein [Rhizobium rhizogenes]NTH22831.1 transporter substrate-binding domain-containing protein [Rhizobium rhizogenes]NTH35861.1 transporter substrate-binding domain-containing protein [Rhizobium rhizogenes]